jgi:uncharacterized RDD family membrane protein YckC
MDCPLCGDHCTCSYSAATRVSAPPALTYEYDDPSHCDSESTTGTSVAPPPRTPASPAVSPSPAVNASPELVPDDLTSDSAPPADDGWKEEVANRLQNYRARRGTRRPRFNGTLSLDFDRAANRMVALAEEPDIRNEFFGAAAPTDEAAAEPFAPAAGDEDPSITAAAPASFETNLIEFPRLPTLFDTTPLANELADPVLDRPRILLVPEEVPTSVAPLADIHLTPDDPVAAPVLDLPLCVAPMGQRFLAGCADALLVLVAAAVFMALVLREVPAPDSRIGFALVAVLPLALWAIYEYLFLVHCATTPGMRLAGLELASFDSEIIRRRSRRARALASMLSAFPLALGLIWALLDDDTLCWHDRITRTYLVPRSTAEPEEPIMVDE